MRPIWKGMISFGLINIPIKLYNATEEKHFDFHLLSKSDMCPIKYKKVCESTGEEVPFKDIVRGYQFEKGSFITIDDNDIKSIATKRSQVIEIYEFVDRQEIGWKYLEKPYYIEPDKGAKKTYALLKETLKKTGKVGLAKFVMHTKEYLVAITVEDDLLTLNHLRFPDQLLPASELDLPEKNDFTQKELAIAIMLIKELSTGFNPKRYKDSYSNEMRAMIAKKIKGEPIHVKAVEMPMPTLVQDIMSKLKESLEYAKVKKGKFNTI